MRRQSPNSKEPTSAAVICAFARQKIAVNLAAVAAVAAVAVPVAVAVAVAVAAAVATTAEAVAVAVVAVPEVIAETVVKDATAVYSLPLRELYILISLVR